MSSQSTQNLPVKTVTFEIVESFMQGLTLKSTENVYDTLISSKIEEFYKNQDNKDYELLSLEYFKRAPLEIHFLDFTEKHYATLVFRKKTSITGGNYDKYLKYLKYKNKYIENN
jgi:hypothetical protein